VPAAGEVGDEDMVSFENNAEPLCMFEKNHCDVVHTQSAPYLEGVAPHLLLST
jgi:hypothetical protein